MKNVHTNTRTHKNGGKWYKIATNMVTPLWCAVDTWIPTWTPLGRSAIDGTDGFAHFAIRSRCQVPVLQLGVYIYIGANRQWLANSIIA